MFSKEMDAGGLHGIFNPVLGGVLEADWANMLLRMYC
jgi:hypothetical protein